jgi:hypothetical protein
MKPVLALSAALLSALVLSACTVNTSPAPVTPVVVQQPAPTTNGPATVIVPRTY